MEGSSRMSSTGTTTSRSSCLRWPASTSRIGRPPETNLPISSSGRCVAESADPLQRARSTRRSSRSTESARCAPRFVPATACTSSRISVRTERSVSRACEVSSRKSDSGVVIRTSGGCRSIRGALALRRVAGADADGELGAEAGERAAQVPLDVVVQRLQRRDVEQAQPFARRLVQAVDPVEEGGERLARAGRRLHEHVLARRDRRPRQRLGRRRRPRRRARTRPAWRE